MPTLRTLGLVSLVCLTLLTPAAPAQEFDAGRLDIAWNRLYDYDQTTGILHDLVAAYPNLLQIRSLGQSVQGREMWLVTLNNPATGSDDSKPAMYIDANIHGNEIQGTEVVLYSIWYLAKSYGKVDALTELVDRMAFYFVPMVNPDSRAHWFREPNNPHSQRSGQRPTDNDYDGMFDEDGPEDLDGDGHIGFMWRFDPNGTHRRNRKDPRMIERVDADEKGELRRAGSEGIDNDGDGRVNEDGPGGYDMNRNWAGGWQPNYIQYGSGDYPFSFPETAAIAAFVLEHPNIAAGQSYHNAGGMILRGPGAKYREALYGRADRRVYDELGKAGEEMLPFYRYMVIHADLYTVHGGTVNWLAEGLGILSFTNELWSDARILQNKEKQLDREARMRWQDRVMFGQTFTDWTEYDHPTYGRVLIGGGTKHASRNPPTFMIEEECHRNFAFTMFHADHMPLLSFNWVEVKSLGGDVWQITVEVENEKLIPTRLALAAKKKIGLPDRMSVEGAEVVASGTLSDRFDKSFDPVEHRRDVIFDDSGVRGRARSTFRFIVQGAPGADVTLRYQAEKARDLEMTVELRAQVVE